MRVVVVGMLEGGEVVGEESRPASSSFVTRSFSDLLILLACKLIMVWITQLYTCTCINIQCTVHVLFLGKNSSWKASKVYHL